MYTLKVLSADDHESFHRIISTFLKGTFSFDATSPVTYGTSTTIIPYTFNNNSMTVTPIVVTNLNSFIINSQPSVNPTGTLAGNSVNRKYTLSFNDTGFIAEAQLAYLAAELTGTVAKLKNFQDGISKTNKLGGTYIRNNNVNGFDYQQH